jgi:hypothetical protein
MQKPWELNPKLKDNYLIQIAQFIDEVRASVVEHHNEELGDTNRVLGYRAYECCRSRIIKAAGSQEMPWLGIVNEDYRFTFSIEGVPMRFYRGIPESPEERRLIPSIESRHQMSLLPVSTEIANILWFFVVETDEFKQVDKVTFTGFNLYNELVSLWEVPLNEKVKVQPYVVTKAPEAIVQQPVTLAVKSKKKSLDEVNNE